MTTKANDTLNKAYGSIPKEVSISFNIDIPTFRGFKFYWLKLLRKIQGR
jgi:hypothetical protein